MGRLVFFTVGLCAGCFLFRFFVGFFHAFCFAVFLVSRSLLLVELSAELCIVLFFIFVTALFYVLAHGHLDMMAKWGNSEAKVLLYDKCVYQQYLVY